MRVMTTFAIATAASIGFAGGAGSLSAQDGPLFISHDLVALTIRAPFEDIFEHRGEESVEYPGVVVVRAAVGQSDTVDVDIRTRGRARLANRICRFPPLRLDFPRDSVEGTLFAGQDKLKLVTHCQDDREEYEQYVLLEHLIYRIYNTLTELSFRVRLARITYEDTGGDRDTVTRYGFLIEHEEAVAERTGWAYLATPVVPPDAIEPENLAQAELFHYLIGNTDWSAFEADPGSSECCHNTKPIGALGGPVFTVPHDFDTTGLVNTRYANRLFRGHLENLGLRNVRQRRFRGLCRSARFWPALFATFNERRAEIEALFQNQDGLDADVLEETLDYIADFYEVINDEGRVRQELEGHCRGI
jgi:hypothetical protein